MPRIGARLNQHGKFTPAAADAMSAFWLGFGADSWPPQVDGEHVLSEPSHDESLVSPVPRTTTL